MSGEYSGSHLERVKECSGVNVIRYCIFPAPTKDVFSGNISYQFVFRHRATADALHRAIESAAAGIVRGLHFFFPAVGRGMEMGANTYITEFRDELAEYVRYIIWLRHAYGIRHGYRFNAYCG